MSPVLAIALAVLCLTPSLSLSLLIGHASTAPGFRTWFPFGSIVRN